ncbi:MAG: hypothetical protein ACRENH_07715 [Gemmatimonadaceae bacterium]
MRPLPISMRRNITWIWIAWLTTFALALTCVSIVVKGVLRDRRVGEPVLSLDLARRSDWRSSRFRVWGSGTYTLFISSVNWDSTFAGAPLGAELEVAVLTPSGKPVFKRMYAARSTGLRLPINYGDSHLADVSLRDWPVRRYTLAARVLAPDEHFKTAQSVLKLYKQRSDPGMGGMMNYVMIFPAAVLMFLAVVAALSLARAGKRVPIVITAVAGVLLLALIGT